MVECKGSAALCVSKAKCLMFVILIGFPFFWLNDLHQCTLGQMITFLCEIKEAFKITLFELKNLKKA